MSVQVVKRSFTVAEYRRMVEVGILSEDDRVELIDGEVFEMSPIREPHAASVDVLNEVVQDHLGRSVIVRVQGPIQLNDFSEPQPDISILKRRDDFYRRSHPRPEDVLLVVEVSDSTVQFDRKVKVPLYARAGIPEAWVVNLPEERVEVYSDPAGGEYRTVRTYARGEELQSRTLASLRVSVAELLG
jgi:Uma2 family endonuclease